MALVPGKPIIANRGIDYIPRLNSAPESTIKTNLRINYFLNLTHLARTINSLTGGKSLSKQTKWRNDCSRERKFQQREIDPEQLTDEEPGSRYIVQVWPRVNQISSRNPKSRSPKADEKKPRAVTNFSKFSWGYFRHRSGAGRI